MLTSTVAKSGNGRIAFYGPGNVAIDEHNLPADGGLGSIAHSLKEMGNLAQIVAYETGFAALNAKGEVYTWGDSRYPACLGRDTDETSPPSTPGLVADLVGLPTGKITKIAAGGYLLMAVTEAHDLYAWGGHPGQPALIEGLSHNPSPVVVEENDVVDMAVGAHHAIILTEGRELFVIGENANGQLGLPKEKKTVSWTKVPFPLEPGSSIHSVACGPRNTFVIVRKE
ncbi:regulator of chromosome condensation 1/beta-lactamase-inhibitor protein II [Truncatella angustata]|uniref:Regulator of chromosome condensation 1/beta-lactamase-inhibitor protein II n=1 Tax=Truncatella angustata TaxID=152316 RepID=A0A9P8ZZ36_9PEZI|nr:regulator of chromosome condensation 1/beta-lactamase-inhibitor protein II [Truncatella angustata]KAH6656777.1 regulator of chromosome condensation 1/beta-lactamase-inhibitor protein II [Truncatella angustata]